MDTSKVCVGIAGEKIFTAFYGEAAPREPWDSNISSLEELQESEEFWATHALCYEKGAYEEE